MLGAEAGLREGQEMNVLVPAIPGRLQISQGMIEDLLYDPVMAATIFLGVDFDAFQGVKMRYKWFTPYVEDSSGYSSSKTIIDFCVMAMRAVLLPEQVCMVIYPVFEQGKKNFWKYFNELGTRLWRAQLGRFDMMGEEEGKSNVKGASCWVQHFKNGSQIWMPAPGVDRESVTLAGLRTNTILVDEFNKVYGMNGGQTAMTQIMTRNSRESFNKEHPIWRNHVMLSSTAELSDHPAYKIHQNYDKKAKQGDPAYATLAFCYKDYSNLPTKQGKSFKQRFRDDGNIEIIRQTCGSEEKFAAEALGLWLKQSRGWYTREMIESCARAGAQRGLEVILSSAACPYMARGYETHYFLGIDPAPAQHAKNDDGTMVVLRAAKPKERSGESASDWVRDFIYARRVRGKDADEWAGLVHEKHQDFGFSMICIDVGGGGQWVGPLLGRPQQKIGGVQRGVTPILQRHTNVFEGTPLYFLLSRGEEDLKGEQGLWHQELKNARGDDVLKNLANTLLRTDIEKGLIGLPRAHHERRLEETAGWGEELSWASKCLTMLRTQLLAYKVAVNEDGTWRLTANNQKIFFSEEMDDFHDAARNADVAFYVWHRGFVNGEGLAREDEEQCCFSVR